MSPDRMALHIMLVLHIETLVYKIQRYWYLTNDSVLGKRVLTYWENRGYINHCHLNIPTVPIENYAFLERTDLLLFKNR